MWPRRPPHSRQGFSVTLMTALPVFTSGPRSARIRDTVLLSLGSLGPGSGHVSHGKHLFTKQSPQAREGFEMSNSGGIQTTGNIVRPLILPCLLPSSPRASPEPCKPLICCLCVDEPVWMRHISELSHYGAVHVCCHSATLFSFVSP